ncbi:hypothetical protein BaRGS_00025410 [Batillaria attramentaria]|uniref:Uncharacterized protein n=1 Tax=Batillaria attramentaria TaxID=370345 RepID=A0ABD0K8G5_9CAEN
MLTVTSWVFTSICQHLQQQGEQNNVQQMLSPVSVPNETVGLILRSCDTLAHSLSLNKGLSNPLTCKHVYRHLPYDTHTHKAVKLSISWYDSPAFHGAFLIPFWQGTPTAGYCELSNSASNRSGKPCGAIRSSHVLYMPRFVVKTPGCCTVSRSAFTTPR